MNYLTKNRGISGKGLQRIAKEVGVPTRKRSQDLSGEVQRWADVILDAIYDTLESVPSDVPSGMVLRTVYDSLAIHAIPSITKTQGSKKSSRRRKAQEWTAMDEFTTSYAETALWSTTDMNEEGDMGESLDENYGLEDLAPETVKEMIEDCKDFQEANADLLERAYEATGNDEAQAGHDFWLTRNGHGAGFWDGDWGDFGDELTEMSKPHGEVNLYVGDDGKIYS